jgi:hypothetical protein
MIYHVCQGRDSRISYMVQIVMTTDLTGLLGDKIRPCSMSWTVPILRRITKIKQAEVLKGTFATQSLYLEHVGCAHSLAEAT